MVKVHGCGECGAVFGEHEGVSMNMTAEETKEVAQCVEAAAEASHKVPVRRGVHSTPIVQYDGTHTVQLTWDENDVRVVMDGEVAINVRHLRELLLRGLNESRRVGRENGK